MKLRNIFAALTCAAALIALTACDNEPSEKPVPDYPVEAAGTIIQQFPSSVASLSPSNTETLRQIGLGGRLSAISDYCKNPLEPGDLEYYEYARTGSPQLPDIDEIVRSGAKVVFTVTELTESQTNELLQNNIDIVVIPPAADLDGLYENYRTYFRVMHGEVRGSAMADEFISRYSAKLDSIFELAKQAAPESPQSAVYIAGDLLQLATGDTLEGKLLEAMGMPNWGAQYTDYIYPQEKQLELEPDIILYNGLLSAESIRTSACYKDTAAVKNDRMLLLDSGAFERQSPDIATALWDIGEFLYPDRFVSPVPLAQPPIDDSAPEAEQNEEE